jgi:hypothetical protein
LEPGDSSTGQIGGSVVRDTKPQPNGVFGDGLRSRPLTVRAITSSGFNLSGVAHDDSPYNFGDQGGNLCGCPTADSKCKSTSTNVEPPKP